MFLMHARLHPKRSGVCGLLMRIDRPFLRELCQWLLFELPIRQVPCGRGLPAGRQFALFVGLWALRYQLPNFGVRLSILLFCAGGCEQQPDAGVSAPEGV